MRLADSFLGRNVLVTIDRPLGSKHPKHGFEYSLNYGYIPNTVSGDEEELDAYILDVPDSLQTFEGLCIGYIHRTNDDDDKLLVVKNINRTRSEEEIRRLVYFQEQWFESEVILVTSNREFLQHILSDE